jgi:hypothetical protein
MLSGIRISNHERILGKFTGILTTAFLLLILSTQSFSQGNRDLKESAWICHISEVHDSILFKSADDYIFYTAENDTHTFGFYKLAGDTVFLYQQYGERDKDFPTDPEHREGKKFFKLVLEKNTLRMVYADHSGRNAPITTFDTNYYFTQIKK